VANKGVLYNRSGTEVPDCAVSEPFHRIVSHLAERIDTGRAAECCGYGADDNLTSEHRRTRPLRRLSVAVISEM
jgi:hypothetical protein